MASPLIQTSFAAGELAPHLFGRTDLQKYTSGAAMMRNFFVDYRGGASTRPGTEFVGVVDSNAAPPRVLPFEFNTQQTYILLISASGKMFFISQGAFVTEAAVAISGASTGSGLQVIAASGTYAVGDLVYVTGASGLVRPNGISGVNARVFRVAAVAGTTLTLVDPVSGSTTAATWTPYTAGGTVARLYSIAHPWSPADFQALTFTQSADVLTITHPNYPPYRVNRFGPTNWTITSITLGTAQAAPINGSAIGYPGTYPSGITAPTQGFAYGYQITAVSSSGEESQPLTITCTNIALNQTYGTVNTLGWAAPAQGAAYYNIYKGTPFPTGQSGATFYGFIGTTTRTNFCDNNFEADFSTVPPTHQSPFTNVGGISSASIGQPGFGYISPQVIVGNAPGAVPVGSGGAISLTVNTNGAVNGYSITAAGADYSAPTATVYESDTTLGSGLALAFSGSTTVYSGSGFGSTQYRPADGSVTISAAGSGYHIAYIQAQFTTGFVQAGTALGLVVGGVVTSIVWQTYPLTTTTSGAALEFFITDILPGDARAPGSQAFLSVQAAGSGGPGVCAYFQQRIVYAASSVAPDTFWMSRPGSYDNFDTSLPSMPDDALTGTIVSNQVNAINSLTAMQSGLIALTSNGAYLLSGGTPGAALSPSTLQAQTQAFSGASALPPLKINYDLLYEQSRGSGIRDLEYNFYVNVYTGQLISALSSHLFDGHKLIQWDYAEEPFYLVWAVRDDGALLSLTYLKEQNIFGWARHDTDGVYCGVSVIPENNADVPYFVTQRLLGGQWQYVVERQASRQYASNNSWNTPTNPEAVFCVDAGATTESSNSWFPDATLTMAPAAEDATSFVFNSSSAVFNSGMPGVGVVLRVAGGVGTITGYTSPTEVTVTFSRPMTAWVPNKADGTQVIAPQAPGDWSITDPFTVVGGLDHLNGLPVALVVDGSVVTPQTVVDGCITLPNAASMVTAGLGYTCQLQTLRLDAGEPTVASRRKTMPALTVRANETRGLFVGSSWDTLYEIKQRYDEPLGTPMNFESGGAVQPAQITGGPTGQVPWYTKDRRTVIAEKWATEGQYCIQQSYPMPATVLATIIEASIGDQPSQ